MRQFGVFYYDGNEIRFAVVHTARAPTDDVMKSVLGDMDYTINGFIELGVNDTRVWIDGDRLDDPMNMHD
jgi:hypothetical protein